MLSRNLTDLHPGLIPLVLAAQAGWRAADLDVHTLCTYRDLAEQARLYAQGRTTPGKIVTRAMPGHSAHNYVGADGRPAALAIDVAPFRDGAPVWGTHGEDGDLWAEVGRIGQAAGLVWYGAPDAEFREYPHFQHPQAVQYLHALELPRAVNT